MQKPFDLFHGDFAAAQPDGAANRAMQRAQKGAVVEADPGDLPIVAIRQRLFADVHTHETDVKRFLCLALFQQRLPQMRVAIDKVRLFVKQFFQGRNIGWRAQFAIVALIQGGNERFGDFVICFMGILEFSLLAPNFESDLHYITPFYL